MRVLVTGGAGFIGSFVVEQLVAAGHDVQIYDVLDPQVHPAGRPDYLPAAVPLTVADIRDREQLAVAVGAADAVIHAAAAVGVGQSLYRVEHYTDVNVRGTGLLLELIAARPRPLTKLVVFTSMTGYGEGLYRQPASGALVRPAIRSAADIAAHGWDPVAPDGAALVPVPTPEDAALLAANVYALTKRYQEELALSLGALYGFPVTCLRLFNVYGPRQSLRNPYTGVLAIFLSRLLAGERPVVYEDGAQSRDFVSVHDVARAAVQALSAPASDGQVLNIGSGVARTVADCARSLAALLGLSELPPEITGQFRTGDIRHCVADICRAEERLGFAPLVRWEDGLSELISWAQRAPRSNQFAAADGELRARGLVNDDIAAAGAAPRIQG